MKKLTSVLALGAMTLIIGCGGDDRFVEFNKNELNPFVEKGFELIKKKQ
ncbi:hypothetical protein OLP48_07220 [Campylobacter jejuni]|nr:hypothetical protein [Campylobacter jejuni]